MGVTVSIIIPVLNEEARIAETIDHIRSLTDGNAAEIIVVDGDPAGGTLRAIPDGACRKLLSEPGRGRQLNRGAGGRLRRDPALPPRRHETPAGCPGLDRGSAPRPDAGGRRLRSGDRLAAQSLPPRSSVSHPSAPASPGSPTAIRRSSSAAPGSDRSGDSATFPSWRTWTSCGG